jgi:orotidine-5'-phosphate decarboxylase
MRLDMPIVSKTLSPIILALDTKDKEQAARWIDQTRESVDIYKIGLEFFLLHGVSGVKELQARYSFELFLDLKLHDIPNTVAGAAESIKKLNPYFLTVHAAGGAMMIAGAAKALPDTRITAVTVLTSLSANDLVEIGMKDDPMKSAVRLAQLSVNSGARAIVSSPLEVADIRRSVPGETLLITPGVRPKGSAVGDQQRVTTPEDAISAGANYVVIGRPITGASAPGEAASAIRKVL